MLPKPKSKYGYSKAEIVEICKERGIKLGNFWKAFGVNTVAIENNENRYYTCDVERALYKLQCKDGKNHPWD